MGKYGDRHGEGPIFNDPNWEKLPAPVVPPPWVIKKLEETRLPVEWGNTGMFYCTEYDGKKFVTKLLPGSPQPVEGWLW